MQFPDYFKVSINSIPYFSFLMPVTAFGIEDDMILEISAEYFKSKDGTQYLANVWARQNKAKTKHFVFPVAVPVCDDPETEIIKALNIDERFDAIMHDLIYEIAKHRCD